MRANLKRWLPILSLAGAALLTIAGGAFAQQAAGPDSIIKRISSETERLQLTVNTSRLLTLERRIPRAQVDNPEVLDVVPRSANQIQVRGLRPGFTTLTLWDETDRVHTVDVHVVGDARELAAYLRHQFPKAKLSVTPLNSRVVVEGMVDDPAQVPQIVAVTQDFFPDVINRITVGGVRQVLLEVRVMEVSRTKLRTLGFDFAAFSGDDFAVSSVSGLISSFTPGAVATSAGETFTFGVVSGDNAFFGVLEAMRQNNLAKVLAEPKIVAISGRPASFNVGGEFPVPVPQSLGTISIEYRRYGTEVNFVPIVLSNGNIRLEVRPRVSELDSANGVTIESVTVPALRSRDIDTAVELRSGQTLAIGGLVQTRNEAEVRGVPWLMDIPYLGAPFRRTRQAENDIELLIVVTPHLVEPLECHEMPQCGPGQFTAPPRDCEQYAKGYVEVPACCPLGGPGMFGPHGYESGTVVEQVPAREFQGVSPSVQPVPVLPSPGYPNGSPQPTPQPNGSQGLPGNGAPAPTSEVLRLGPADSGASQRTYNPQNRNVQQPATQFFPQQSRPEFVGETGYDVRK